MWYRPVAPWTAKESYWPIMLKNWLIYMKKNTYMNWIVKGKSFELIKVKSVVLRRSRLPSKTPQQLDGLCYVALKDALTNSPDAWKILKETQSDMELIHTSQVNLTNQPKEHSWTEEQAVEESLHPAWISYFSSLWWNHDQRQREKSPLVLA